MLGGLNMPNPLNLVVFIDAQNTYRGARRAFFSNTAPAVNGQINPMQLGKLIEARGGPGGAECQLTGVRIYTGRPDSRKDSKTYAAHSKQCEQWQSDGAVVIPRPLRYPPNWPTHRAQEKGIDVALSIDFIAMAVDGDYDVGVIMSTDTDMLPALEFTIKRYGARRVAVAAWHGENSGSRLRVPGYSNLWCHRLYRADYDSVADFTNYNR